MSAALYLKFTRVSVLNCSHLLIHLFSHSFNRLQAHWITVLFACLLIHLLIYLPTLNYLLTLVGYLFNHSFVDSPSLGLFTYYFTLLTSFM